MCSSEKKKHTLIFHFRFYSATNKSNVQSVEAVRSKVMFTDVWLMVIKQLQVRDFFASFKKKAIHLEQVCDDKHLKQVGTYFVLEGSDIETSACVWPIDSTILIPLSEWVRLPVFCLVPLELWGRGVPSPQHIILCCCACCSNLCFDLRPLSWWWWWWWWICLWVSTEHLLRSSAIPLSKDDME